MKPKVGEVYRGQQTDHRRDVLVIAISTNSGSVHIEDIDRKSHACGRKEWLDQAKFKQYSYIRDSKLLKRTNRRQQRKRAR